MHASQSGGGKNLNVVDDDRQERMMRDSNDDTDLQAGEVANPDVWLQALGYTPELVRSRSTFQVAFMSFVLASIPYGLATTLFYPLNGGGSTCVIWGWLAVSCIIMCVAASLGEITSVFPTAGVSAPLGPPTSMLMYLRAFTTRASCCRPFGVVGLMPGSAVGIALSVSHSTRDESLVTDSAGQITITLSVQFATALFLIGCINIFESEPGVGIFEATTWQTYLVFLAIVFVCNVVSALGNRWLPLLDVCLPKRQVYPKRSLTSLHRHLPFSGPLSV